MRNSLLFSLLCFALLLPIVSSAQERAITGRVSSAEDGTALPGVNVVVKGTTNGTVTDVNGSYRLSIPQDGGTLVFSFIGLQTQEAVVGDRAVVDVSLGMDVKQLSEIVVTGTGVATEKRKLAISVESVTSDKLPQAPTASIDQALVGKIAGAQISSIDGTPGANINILLRGVNSINKGTNPMILVDGVQMGATNLNSIDLNTIDRVEVIQGAAAGTIYGAQGANGVIQLFTKKGKSGKLNVDISTGMSQNTMLNIGDVRQSRLHNFSTNTAGELVSANGAVITLDPSTMLYSGNVVYNALAPNGKFDKPYAANLPWIDQLNRYLVTGTTINNSIALSGGGEKVDFSISVSNNRQESNFKNDGYNDRTNFTSNIGFTVAKGLELRSITQLVYTKNTVNFFNQPGYGGGSVIYNMLNTRPFADYDLKDVDGNYGYRYGDAAGVNGRNPNYRYQYSSRDDNKVDILQSFAAVYKPASWLELTAKYGLNYQTELEHTDIKNQDENRNVIAQQLSYVSIYNTSGAGEINNYENTTVFQNFVASATGILDFENDLKTSIPLKSTTMAAFDWRKSDNHLYFTYGLNTPTYTPYSAQQANSYRILLDQRTPFVTYGFLVNQRFDYDDFIGISGGFRSDYSSAFGAGSKPFTFPRGDAYLRLSGMSFWDNSGISKTILEFKLRAAYGKAGIQPYPFDRYVTLGTRALGDGIGFYYPFAQSNPNLDVEVSTETEIGTDIALDLLSGNWFKTLNLSATYWTRETENAIYDVDTAPSTGVGTVKDNAFGIQSHGLQISLNMPVLSSSNLNWNLTTNFGKQYSEISSVKNNVEVVVLSNAGSSNYVLRAGEAVGQLYGYKVLRDIGMLDLDGNPIIPVSEQANYEIASNGYVVHKTSKQPVGTPDLYSLGNSFPDFNMSFINDFNYKGYLTFGFQFDWVYNSHLYNQTKSWLYRDGIHSDYEKPITINGETGAWTAFYRGIYQAGANNGTKDYFYENATFLRLRNVAIGLDFAKLFKIPAFRRLQLVLSGRNLFTITNYSGFDPEISSGGNGSAPSALVVNTANTNQAGNAFDRGVDHSTLPNYKSYQATLNISF